MMIQKGKKERECGGEEKRWVYFFFFCGFLVAVGLDLRDAVESARSMRHLRD